MSRLLCTAIILLIATSSYAADLASKKSEQTATTLFPRWEGFYFGFNRGFGGGVVDNNAGLISTNQNYNLFSSTTNRASGFIAGGQVGYLHQFENRFSLGFETDFQWSDLKASYQGQALATNPSFITNADTRTGINWFGTGRGRLGYSIGRLFPYVTGGVAYGQIQTIASPLMGSNTIAASSATQNRVGWVMGGGAEIAISKNLSAKSEYLYMTMLGSNGNIAGATIPAGMPLMGSFGSSMMGVHILRGGMNYKYTGIDNIASDWGEYQPLLEGRIVDYLLAQPARDWSGFYAGVNGGYGGDIFRSNSTILQGASSNTAPLAAVSTTTNRTGGILGGGQVGNNYQIYNRLVVGVETDAQWTGIVGQHVAISAENPAGSVIANEKFSLDWFGTTRLRAGLVRGDALSYFTAGVAYGGVSLNSNDYSGGYFANATTQTKAGWAVGTGTEYAITSDMSFRADYLYTSLSGISGPIYGFTTSSSNPLLGLYSTRSITNNILRVGVNWKFGKTSDNNPIDMVSPIKSAPR